MSQFYERQQYRCIRPCGWNGDYNSTVKKDSETRACPECDYRVEINSQIVDDLVSEITGTLNGKLKNLHGTHLMFIRSMVEDLYLTNHSESPIFQLTYDESIKRKALYDAANMIKSDIINKRTKYTWHDDKPKDDFEQGAYSAMRLLYFIVHCMYP